MSRSQKLILLGAITFVSIVVAFAIRPVAQSEDYHHFADSRKICGITNFLNVITNLPFIIIGCIGLALLPKGRNDQLLAYSFLFAGILLTAFGSGYYHLNPDNNTLVYDRIPMTNVFRSLLSATVSETINARLGHVLLFPLLLVGIGSVLYWHFTESAGHGDLRLYGLVQFFPLLFIPLVLILFPSAQARAGVRQLVWVVAWYVIAKIFECFDLQIYSLGHIVSGHTLKHLAAAVSTCYLMLLFKHKYVLHPKI